METHHLMPEWRSTSLQLVQQVGPLIYNLDYSYSYFDRLLSRKTELIIASQFYQWCENMVEFAFGHNQLQLSLATIPKSLVSTS